MSFLFKAKKAKSKCVKTPPKAEAERRKISPPTRESEPKKKKVTPEKDNTVRSPKKQTMEARRGLDFDQKAPEKKDPKDVGSPIQKGSKGGAEVLLWVDKYKPTSLKTIIGQQGDQSCANKLLRWLRNWHRNISQDKHGNCATNDSSGTWHLFPGSWWCILYLHSTS